MALTDRELLELAAKADGMKDPWSADQIAAFQYDVKLWSPLSDDGDALRLAVKLSLVISPSDVSVMVWLPGEVDRGEVWEPIGFDQFTATRRAIVRAAAEIGKAMP